MERDRSPVRGRPVTGFADARFKILPFWYASWIIMAFWMFLGPTWCFVTSSWIAWVGILVPIHFFLLTTFFWQSKNVKSVTFNAAASGSIWTLNPKKTLTQVKNPRLMLKYSFQYEFTRVLSQLPLCAKNGTKTADSQYDIKFHLKTSHLFWEK